MNMVPQNLWQYCGGDLFTIDQTEYIFVDQDRNGISLETVREPRVTEYFSHDQLHELGRLERLKYVRDGAALKMNPAILNRLEVEFPDDLVKQKVLWKKLYCD